MPIIASRVTVTDASTLIFDPTHGSSGDPVSAVLRNAGSVSIFMGGAGVTAATGYELASGGNFSVELMAGDLLYGITASGSAVLHVMRFRQ